MDTRVLVSINGIRVLKQLSLVRVTFKLLSLLQLKGGELRVEDGIF